MKHYSLRTMISFRFAWMVLAVVFLISILSNILISRQFEKYVGQQQDREAQELVLNLSGQYDAAADEWNLDYIHGLGMYALNEGYIIRLSDREGKVVWDAQNHDMTLCADMMDSISLRMKEKRPELEGDFVTRCFALRQEDETVGFLEVGYYSPYYLDKNEFRFLESLNRILAAVGIFSLLGAVGMGVLFADNLTRPIRKTVKTARSISNGDYSIRVGEGVRSRELSDLLQSVNQMAESLEKQENLRKRLTSDVAHELRTPLANVSSYLEAILEGVWEPSRERLQSCYDELGRISRLVSELERLRQAENGNMQLDKTRVDLLELAQTAVKSFERQLEEKKLCCTVLGDFTPVTADRDRMLQVIANLLSNAIKYSEENGQIRLMTENREDAGVLRVEDEGIGIPEEEREQIFERFYRTDQSRSRKTGGAGIGLTIARAIVSAHGGKILAESGEKRGSRFTVILFKEDRCRETGAVS